MGNFSIASCCFLIGSASLQTDTAHSFLAPESLVRRTQSRKYSAAASTALSVLTPSTKTDQKIISTARDAKLKSNDTNNVADDLWVDDNDTKSIGLGLSLDSLVDAPDSQITIEEQDSADLTKWILIGGTIMVLGAAGALAVTMGNDLGIDLELGQLIKDPSTTFDTIITSLGTMDPQKGMIYFSSFYILAEILAIPAVPILTASSGYLFGSLPGTVTCLFSASIAASISFVIGRTLLRGYVERVLADNPKFQSMDKAIEKEGFKLMLLLRLSPLFPFALSNYLYGASSIRFLPYFFGTLLGFAPGTFAYVYAGRIGKALTIDSASAEPWYVYVGGMAVVVALLKIAGDVASGVIDSMEEGDVDGR
eukprot:CAMPEP_0172304558 /NCGR_PEP_ID=MMETSP1058-20130122/5951_1 /TAXON_ID=83371 /ORGANISM="Detonula confervacea, Strain CCMP 353" /LENGTH=365 /DNA_ID=CAMNT_0013015835 /DNA_START=139 /DNA_END=1236 /DNA_ORIENTATION=+